MFAGNPAIAAKAAVVVFKFINVVCNIDSSANPFSSGNAKIASALSLRLIKVSIYSLILLKLTVFNNLMRFNRFVSASCSGSFKLTTSSWLYIITLANAKASPRCAKAQIKWALDFDSRLYLVCWQLCRESSAKRIPPSSPFESSTKGQTYFIACLKLFRLFI